MTKNDTYGFEARNRSDYDRYSALIENAIVKIMQNEKYKATKGEIGRLTGIHPNTLKRRHWECTQHLSYGEWELAKGEPTSVDQLLNALKRCRDGAQKRKAPIATDVPQSEDSKIAALTQKLNRALYHNALITVDLRKVCEQLDETKAVLASAQAMYKRDIEKMNEELQKIKKERDELTSHRLNNIPTII